MLGHQRPRGVCLVLLRHLCSRSQLSRETSDYPEATKLESRMSILHRQPHRAPSRRPGGVSQLGHLAPSSLQMNAAPASM